MMSGTEVERRDERARLQVEQALSKIEAWTENTVRRLRMTNPVRQKAEAVARKVRRARRWLFWQKHTDTQARILRCMILLALATDPALESRAGEVARYYSRNYAWEWLNNVVTSGAREQAKDMIMRAGDSEWGEAPLAGALSYVLFHHEEVKLEHLSSYGEAYTRALRLDESGFFHDLAPEARQRLGLALHDERRQRTLQRVEGEEGRSARPAENGG